MQHSWAGNEKFAECRTMTGHRWYRAEHPALDGREMQMAHRCRECGTVRHVWFDVWSGEVTARWYEYPEGYCETYAKGKKRPSRSDLRVVYLRRLVKEGRPGKPKRRRAA